MKEKVIGAGLLAICPETGRFIMLKRREDIEYPGYWNLPGGNFDEEDKYPKITAIREFKEETGYKGPIKISNKPIDVYSNNHIDFYTYAAILPWEFVPDLKGECENGDENLDYAWVSVLCKWGYEEKIIPSVIKALVSKENLIKKIVNKFKNKNYE